MLVLTRRKHQRIFIGDDIVIQVVRIDRDRVRIGIEARKEVPIHREEVARTTDEARPRPGRSDSPDFDAPKPCP